MVARGHEAFEDGDTIGIELEVMEAPAVLDAAHFYDLQATALGAVFLGCPLQTDHPMGDTVELQVAILGGLIVEQQHCAVARDEEVLERQNLPTVTQCVLGQKAHLRQAVEHDPHRSGFLHLAHHATRRLAQFNVGRV
jgi:hypothetical protein